MQTYRYRGHSMSDPVKYRTRDEVQKVRERQDPIEQLRARLVEGGTIDDAALKAIDRDIKKTVAEAAEHAQTSPEPDVSELMTDVMVDADGGSA